MGDIHPFEATISVVGPIVGGIVFLTFFFKTLAWISEKSKANGKPVPLGGILNPDNTITVHLNNGNTYENVRFVGQTDGYAGKGAAFPYELNQMVILEFHDGRRVLIHAKSIRMIEIPNQNQ